MWNLEMIKPSYPTTPHMPTILQNDSTDFAHNVLFKKRRDCSLHTDHVSQKTRYLTESLSVLLISRENISLPAIIMAKGVSSLRAFTIHGYCSRSSPELASPKSTPCPAAICPSFFII
jgi:hypothetical protein